MKDNKVYADKVKKLQRTLKRAYGKVEPISYEDPVDALVYAMVSEPITERKAQAAIKRFADYFVDLNDLRVSRPEEIAEIVGEDSEAVREMAATLSQTLTSVFNAHHTVSLTGAKKLGKRQAKQVLEALEGITRFAVSYCMLTSLQGHAVPLTARMIEYLKAEDYVHSDTEDEEIEAFMAKQVSAKDAFECYTHLRTESETAARSRKVKTKTRIAKKKPAQKVAKKVVKKAAKKTAKKVVKTATKRKTSKRGGK